MFILIRLTSNEKCGEMFVYVLLYVYYNFASLHQCSRFYAVCDMVEVQIISFISQGLT